MKKELKSCTGIRLKADMIGRGHPSPFGQKGWDGRALLGQPSKGRRVGFQFFLNNVLLHF